MPPGAAAHAAVLQDRRLDLFGLAWFRQRAPLQALRTGMGAIKNGAQRRRSRHLDAAPGQTFLQLTQQIQRCRISQPLGHVLHHPVDLHQPRRRQQGGAEAVAMARVVVVRPKAIGGERLLDVLAQRRQLTGAMAAGDLSQALQQVALHRHRPRTVGRPVKGRLQQMAQQGHHPHEHRRISHRRMAAMDAAAAGSLIATKSLQQRQGLDGCGHGGGGEKPLALQPGQIAAHGVGIAVADPMEFAQQRCRPFGQITPGQR
jgi:hypothetical protein